VSNTGRISEVTIAFGATFEKLVFYEWAEALKNFGNICYFLKIRHLEEILHPQITAFIELFS